MERVTVGMAGIEGNYRVSYLYRAGKGKAGLEVIVLNEPVASPAKLAQPNRAEIVYVQKRGEWVKIPSDGRTLDRSIEISPTPENQAGTTASFMIPDATGYTTRGRLFEDKAIAEPTSK